ncbi:hypothetical protein Tco_0120376, partial [Tanacetum coccineum]
SYSGLDEFKEPEFKGYGTENSEQESNVVCNKKSDDYKENFDNSLVKEQVSKGRDVNTAKARAVNTVRPQAVNTARPKIVKTARPNSAVVNVVRVNQANAIKASACWVWRPTKPKDFKEFDGGYVAFRGGAHGGRITSKGTHKTDNLDF